MEQNKVVSIPETLLGIHRHEGGGYLPLVDYNTWRVAVLNFSDELRVENITRLQRHNETDEVFVLLTGHCLLLIGEGRDRVERIYAEDLQASHIYNVRRGVWHNHILSQDASVLVVENRDTTYNNSPFTELNAAQQREVQELFRCFWADLS